MTDLRTGQVVVEVVTTVTPDHRTGHVVVEAVSTDASTVRVSQVGIEALRGLGTATPIGVTQVALEVLRTTAGVGFVVDTTRMFMCL